MNTKRITALIGAGATIDIGGMTTGKLTNLAINTEQVYRNEHNEAVKRYLLRDVYDALKNYNKGAVINFEDIWNAVENIYSMKLADMRRNYKSPWGALADLKALFQDVELRLLIEAHANLIETIADNISSYDIDFSSSNDLKCRQFADFFQKSTDIAPWDIVTLNYDTCLEQSLTDKYVDGFSDKESVMGIKSSKAMRFRPCSIQSTGEKSRIMHIHGAINYGMASLSEPHHNKYAFLESFYDMYKYESYDAAKEHWFGHSDPNTQSGEIIFNGPIISGLRKPDKLLSVFPFSYYFYEFQKAILQNNSLFIAGYSCGDDYINNWLSRMAEIHGKKRRIVIVTYYDKSKPLESEAYLTTYRDNVNIVNEGEFEVYSKLGQQEFAKYVHFGKKKLPENGKLVSDDGCVRIYFEGFNKVITEYGDEIIEFLTE